MVFYGRRCSPTLGWSVHSSQHPTTYEVCDPGGPCGWVAFDGVSPAHGGAGWFFRSTAACDGPCGVLAVFQHYASTRFWEVCGWSVPSGRHPTTSVVCDPGGPCGCVAFDGFSPAHSGAGWSFRSAAACDGPCGVLAGFGHCASTHFWEVCTWPVPSGRHPTTFVACDPGGPCGWVAFDGFSPTHDGVGWSFRSATACDLPCGVLAGFRHCASTRFWEVCYLEPYFMAFS